MSGPIEIIIMKGIELFKQGANENWIPGRLTSGEISEAILDLSNPSLPYTTCSF